MQPRISSKDAQGYVDAYAKIYAPPEEPQTETETEIEASAEYEDDYNEIDENGNIIDISTWEE